jgi:hypothetical protein
MKEQYFKFLAITFFLIILWLLAGVFSSYDNEDSMFSSFYLYFYLYESMIFGIVISIIMFILRMIFFRNRNFKKNFFWIFSGYFNMIISIIWITTLLMNIVTIDYTLTELGIPCFCIAIIILADLYFPRKLIENKFN